MNAGVVQEAREWALEMVRKEARGPGDFENAMQRVARRCGVTYSVIWSLHYRLPKDLWASVYLKLRRAYEGERDRQEKNFAHQRTLAAAKAGADAAFIRAADFVAGRSVAPAEGAAPSD